MYTNSILVLSFHTFSCASEFIIWWLPYCLKLYCWWPRWLLWDKSPSPLLYSPLSQPFSLPPLSLHLQPTNRRPIWCFNRKICISTPTLSILHCKSRFGSIHIKLFFYTRKNSESIATKIVLVEFSNIFIASNFVDPFEGRHNNIFFCGNLERKRKDKQRKHRGKTTYANFRGKIYF